MWGFLFNMPTYSELLKDPRWQKKRLEVFKRDKFMCKACKDIKENLQVHHITYFKDMKPHEYQLKYLITLCSTCHNDVTNYKKIIKENIDLNFITPNQLYELCDIIHYSKRLTTSELVQISNKVKSIYTKKQIKKDGKTDKK